MLYKLEKLKRVRGNRTILNIGTLEIDSGQIYTLIGPNGAGKTTLLKILAFLDRPDGGTLHFKEKQVSFSEKYLLGLRREVVLLDQNPILFTGTVRKNVEYGLKIRKIPQDQYRNRVEEMLTLVGMEKFADYDARGLSGGEVKRVALARALALRPSVLLCDEPTANVDRENQEIIFNTLSRINSEENTSIIFSTHYLSQGQRLAHHTLLLQNGSLSDLVNDNIFRSTIIKRSGAETLCQLSGQLFFQLPSIQIPVGGDQVKMHINPRSIVVDPEHEKMDNGSYFDGHIRSLIHERGDVRIVFDIGVELTILLPLAQYLEKPVPLGTKQKLFIPHTSIVCTKTDFI